MQTFFSKVDLRINLITEPATLKISWNLRQVWGYHLGYKWVITLKIFDLPQCSSIFINDTESLLYSRVVFTEPT
jgi:hypothetical protein